MQPIAHYEQEISFKKIYAEVTEDIFNMNSVSIFKETEQKKWGMYIRSTELSKAFGSRNLSYFKIFVVMFLAYRIAGISRKIESERNKNIHCLQMLHT